MRVLIVEDEPLIASDIEVLLTEAGHEVVGVASTLEQALSMSESAEVEAAVLDVNLGGRSAAPVAERLAERRIPFVGISGYSKEQQPEAFQAAPFLSKPFRPSLLIAALSDLMAAR